MVQIRQEGNQTTWILEEDTVSGQLRELAEIFTHHSKADSQNRLDPRFTAEVLALQARALAKAAQQQEEDIERLRRVERELAELREAFAAEMKKMKEAPALDKPALRSPTLKK